MERSLGSQVWLCLAVTPHRQPKVSEKRGAVEPHRAPVTASLLLGDPHGDPRLCPAVKPPSPSPCPSPVPSPAHLPEIQSRPVAPCSGPFLALGGAVTCQLLSPGPSLLLWPQGSFPPVSSPAPQPCPMVPTSSASVPCPAPWPPATCTGPTCPQTQSRFRSCVSLSYCDSRAAPTGPRSVLSTLGAFPQLIPTMRALTDEETEAQSEGV